MNFLNDCKEGNFRAIQDFLLEDVDRDLSEFVDSATGSTGLHYASENGEADMLTLLTSHVTSQTSPHTLDYINQSNNLKQTALMLASEKGYDDCIEVLIEAKAHLDLTDSKGNTACILAGTWGNLEGLQVLLDAKADVNMSNNVGHTAVISCVHTGVFNVHDECLDQLIAAGADLDWVDFNGRSAVMHACQRNRLSSLHQLINAKANIRLVNQTVEQLGENACMIAATRGYSACARVLLENNAQIDVNYTTSQGDTACMWAARMGHTDCVRLLIQSMGDVACTNKDNESVLSLGLQQVENQQLTHYLQRYKTCFESIGQEELLSPLTDEIQTQIFIRDLALIAAKYVGWDVTLDEDKMTLFAQDQTFLTKVIQRLEQDENS